MNQIEDYQAAFLQRHQDQEILCQAKRKIAAMHFGGIVIECLLKSIIVASLPNNTNPEWKTKSNNPGHNIKNPSHDFQRALSSHPRLFSRVQNFPEVVKWINQVQTPSQHFIDLRYSSSEPDDPTYQEWLSAYKSLKSWLQKQATQL
jgi:hypothetical protein